MKKTIFYGLAATTLLACGQGSTAANDSQLSQNKTAAEQISEEKTATLLVWEDLMPVGEEARLAELYSDFFQEREALLSQQVSLVDAAKEANADLSAIIEGSAQDTMEQIGTFNVVGSLNGEKIRIPGYVVPFDFSASSEHDEFLLVPYFGACLHTPPPPPNQIIYVKSSSAVKIVDINEPVWLEGVMSTGKFTSDLGNSAYEVNLSKLEPYEY